MPNLNQLTDILSQNLIMNKARIACLTLNIVAIIQAQNSNLKKIAREFTSGETNSNYRRLQRFFAEVHIDQDEIARLIYKLFNVNKAIISIDRTNWKWGQKNLNIFMLSIVHQGIAIPFRETKAYFRKVQRDDPQLIEKNQFTQITAEHGRVETRQCTQLLVTDWFDHT